MNSIIKKALIISVPMILTGTLFGGWLLLREQKNAQNTPIETIVPENLSQSGEAQPSDTSDTVDTSNWSVYKNEKYRFEFKYPKEWGVEAVPPSDAGGFGWLWLIQDKDSGKPMINIGIFEPNQDPEALYKRLIGIPNITGRGETKSFVVDGHSAYFGKEVKDNYTDYNYAISSADNASVFINFRMEKSDGGYSYSEYSPIVQGVVNSIVFHR